MTLDDLKRLVVDEANDFYFDYEGKRVGVEQIVTNSVATYTMWWGDEEKEYSDFDELLSDGFFDGRSVIDLLDVVEIEFC